MEAGPFSGRRLHFVGIGGAGMSGLALVARALGAEVTGSDSAESSYSARLREAGIEPRAGHDEPPPEGAEVVVSTAIAADNPELVHARAAGAPVLHRGDLLGEVSALRRTIAVAGTHGKTTTASMTTLALVDAGRDPAFLIGGELRALGANAGWGAGDWAVVEADESDRSFLKLAREVAVVTSVELDHHATYRSLGELERAFESFVAPADLAVLGPGVELPSAARSLSYGIDSGDLRADGGGAAAARVALQRRGRGDRAGGAGTPQRAERARRPGGLPRGRRGAGAGRSRAGSLHGGGPPLRGPRAHRRAARVCSTTTPTIRPRCRATLGAARTQSPRRLVVCFQPHLYSRTRLLAREFGRALALADLVVVLDVYPAREHAEDFPGRQRAARGRGGGGRRRRAPGVVAARPVRRRAPAPRRAAARATCS